MAQKSLSFILLSLIPLFLIFFPQIQAQTPTAPAPAPSGPIDIFAILKKDGGNYNLFIKFLNETQVGTQINSQVNNSNEGMTVFAPTDNAFNNLPSGTLNKLNDQQKVELIQYHVLPKFYSFDDLQTVSNPVRTQATGPKGEPFGLNFTGQNNQVNVSSGPVETQVYNSLRKDFPLAVYQLDKVLIPSQFTDAKTPSTSAPAPAAADDSPAKKGSGDAKTTAKEPAPNGAKRINVGILGLISAVFLFCMGALS